MPADSGPQQAAVSSRSPDARNPSRLSTSPPVWDFARLRTATDAAGVALWSWNVDTDEIALDERAHRLWGIPTNHGLVTFEALSARIHPQDLDRVRAAFTATREVLGTYETEFRIMDNDEIRWVSARGQGDDAGIIGRMMFGVFLDVSERKLAEEAREMLANEMSHRVKNLFAIAAALAQISSRSATTPKEMADDITQRLCALGVAHQLIRPSQGEQKKAVKLGDLLAVLLGAYDDKGEIGDRIQVSAPEVLVGEAAITAMALVVHELATNSIKYGALSAAAGTLDISASAGVDEVSIVWTEIGGPPVNVARGREGFGSKLVKKSITDHLGGTIKFDWPAGGAVVTLTMSKARLGS